MSQYKRQWDVNSFTKPRQKAYKISERDDGAWECSCPAWTMHTPRKDCKHIKMIRQAEGSRPGDLVFSVNPESVAEGNRKAEAAREAIAQVRKAPEVVFDGYTIRRRRDDDAELVTPDIVQRSQRGRREL